MNKINQIFNSPLTIEDVELIDKTDLSILERHHLRVLAHCLSCFKQMESQQNTHDLPSREEWRQWCLKQPLLSNDSEFMSVIIEHFDGAAQQLELLARKSQVAPLDLNIKDLIHAARQKNN